MTIVPWAKMTEEQQRIVVAELRGWSNIRLDHRLGLAGCIRLTETKERWVEKIPDYLNDLNAMHKAVCAMTDIERQDY